MFSIFKSVARLFKKSKTIENYKDKINDDTDKIDKAFDLAMRSACGGEITIKYWPNGDTLKALTENNIVKGKETYYNQCIRCLDEKYKEIENKEMKLQGHLNVSGEENVEDFRDYWSEFKKYLEFLCSAIGCCFFTRLPDPYPESIKEN